MSHVKTESDRPDEVMIQDLCQEPKKVGRKEIPSQCHVEQWSSLT